MRRIAMHASRRWLGCTIVAAALSFTACGGGSGGDGAADDSPNGGTTSAAVSESTSGGSAAKLIDACKVVTDDEVDAELVGMNNGAKVSARDSTPVSGGGTHCDITYSKADGHTGAFEMVVAPTSALVFYEGPGTRKPLGDGLGDKAYEISGNYFAIKGNVFVYVVDFPVSPEREHSINLLRAALGRI
jgi:hypothetical protein